MSKKSERKKEQRKKTIRDACFVGAIALVFLVLGIVGFISNRRSFNEYGDSSDKRYVDAEITYAEIHSRKGDYGYKENYWKADVKYEVDGTEYTGKTEFSKEVKQGDTRSIEVYRARNGKYKIPEVTSDTAYKLWSILYIAAAALGLILLIISVIVALPDNDQKKKKAKS